MENDNPIDPQLIPKNTEKSKLLRLLGKLVGGSKNPPHVSDGTKETIKNDPDFHKGLVEGTMEKTSTDPK